MSKQVQFRRGNTAAYLGSTGFIGAQGEVTVDTGSWSLRVHDNVTVGGHEVASVAYVDSIVLGNVGNISFSGNTISTIHTNENLYITPNGAGIVVISSLDVINPIVANISGSATYATTAGSTTSAITAGSAIEVTGNAQPAITSVGTLGNLTVTNPIVGNIAGSSLTATTAGTVTENAQPNITSVGTLSNLTVISTIVGNISGSSGSTLYAADAAFAISANNANYLGNVPASGYELALGYTPYNANINANGYITSAASITGSANNASYLGGLIATDYTLKTDVIAEANNASYLGGVPASSYATKAGQVTVYNAGVDQAIYTGNSQLNGVTPVTVTLPSAYSNDFYRVQVTYNGRTLNTSLMGYIFANVISTTQFTIASATGSDTNSVFWTTFGSVTP